MKISIITVTFNSAATVEETLRSVLEQDHPSIEYIIIDGGSTDGTLDIISKYRSRLAKIISEKDRGLYDAINKGIKEASGEVVGILHSDDYYVDKTVVSDYAKIFEEQKPGAVYSDLYYVSRDGKKIIRKWKSGKFSPGAFLNGWMPPHPTFFVRRILYSQFGNFDDTFKTAADYELMLRFIQKHQIKIAYLPRFTVKMRVGGASNASVQNRVNANMEDRRAWKKNGLKPRFYTLYLKPLRKLSQFF